LLVREQGRTFDDRAGDRAEPLARIGLPQYAVLVEDEADERGRDGDASLAAADGDRFRVVVFPVITGRTGRERIYDGYPDVSLEMIESRTFDGRLQLLEYAPTVLAGPPGTDNADD
jgi:hypothetical protein